MLEKAGKVQNFHFWLTLRINSSRKGRLRKSCKWPGKALKERPNTQPVDKN